MTAEVGILKNDDAAADSETLMGYDSTLTAGEDIVDSITGKREANGSLSNRLRVMSRSVTKQDLKRKIMNQISYQLAWNGPSGEIWYWN